MYLKKEVLKPATWQLKAIGQLKAIASNAVNLWVKKAQLHGLPISIFKTFSHSQLGVSEVSY
jgi:hypothetical protein